MGTGFRPFVYGLYDPAEPGHIRYVGMAFVRASRPYQHSKWAHKPSTRSSHFTYWILKLHAEGREYAVRILEELSEDVSYNTLGFVEKCYIKALRGIGHNLTNIADGGNGGNLGPEVVAKMRATKQGKPNGHEGLKRSPETCARIRAGRKGQPGHPRTPEMRAKISASMMGHGTTDETRRKQSAGVLAAYARKKIGAQAS